jgi:hypothetical protein
MKAGAGTETAVLSWKTNEQREKNRQRKRRK